MQVKVSLITTQANRERGNLINFQKSVRFSRASQQNQVKAGRVKKKTNKKKNTVNQVRKRNAGTVTKEHKIWEKVLLSLELSYPCRLPMERRCW